MIDAGTFVLLFFAAIAVGLFSSLLGIGGGVFMTPLLLLGGFVATQPEAAGTSIAAVVFTGLSASIVYFRRKAIDIRTGLVFMGPAIGGVFLGFHIGNVVSAVWLTIAFGVFLLYPTALMLAGRSAKDLAGRCERPSGARFYVLAALLGLLAGVVTKLFGIGGGTVFVPSLVVFLGIDIVTAVATSLFVMVPTAAVGTALSQLQGNLHLEYALPLILGVVIGAQIGPWIGSRIPKRRLRQLFGLLLLYAAISMIVKGVQRI
jgi:uncharacterized protein